MTIIELPMPPSVNNLFINRGKRRTLSPEYRAWREHAGWLLQSQKPEPIKGPVAVDMAVEDTGQLDLDNLWKAPLDLCVSCGVIQGDSRKYVRDIRAYWSKDVTGCRIEIWEAA